MIKYPLAIGVSGNFQVGKDLFYHLLKRKIPNLARYALADILKQESDLEIQKSFKFSIFNCTPAQKEIARPFLVSYGKQKRQETNGRYWISLLNAQIKLARQDNPDIIPCICDCRYDIYENDEVSWIKDELGGILVNVQKYKIVEGKQVFSLPANSDEAENEPNLIKKANYRIIWPNILENSSYVNNPENLEILERELSPWVDEFLKWVRK